MPLAGSSACSPPIPGRASCATPTRATRRRWTRPAATRSSCPDSPPDGRLAWRRAEPGGAVVCHPDYLWLSYGHDERTDCRTQGQAESLPPAGSPRPRGDRHGSRHPDRADRPPPAGLGSTEREASPALPSPPASRSPALRPPPASRPPAAASHDRCGRRRPVARGAAGRAVTAYVDSSVLLRVLLGQAHALKEWKTLRRAVASALVEVECLRTLDRIR